MKNLFLVGLTITLLAGCATVPTVSTSSTPTVVAKPDESTLYIYRTAGLGTALKKDIWINGECLGETAPGVHFISHIPGNQNVVISTESEFGQNHVGFFAKSGQNYYVKQYIKPGVFVGGSNLKLVSESEAEKSLKKSKQAITGTCQVETIEINPTKVKQIDS